MTRLLLEYRADPKAKDDEGHSALALACLFRHTDAVELMKQYGEA
jgi:ankyrin repeat protein